MESMPEYIKEYKKQLGRGVIQKAYQGLMKYIMDLRKHFCKNLPDFAPGNIYHGYMDMTYFPLFPKSLKHRQLKIAIVFFHETTRFEVWLAANNKQVQAQYWTSFKESDWDKYRIPSTLKGVDSVIEYTLIENPDFSNLDILTEQIDSGTLNFIKDIENFLSKH